MIPIKELEKKSKIIIFRETKLRDFDPLKDLIGIIKTKKWVIVEDILKNKGD
ncbi:MAG: hypothetical protein ACE5HW_04465 [Candidatus Methanofastidiosia archaeon]